MLVCAPSTANVWDNSSNSLTHCLTVAEQQSVAKTQLLQRVSCLKKAVKPVDVRHHYDDLLLEAPQLERTVQLAACIKHVTLSVQRTLLPCECTGVLG